MTVRAVKVSDKPPRAIGVNRTAPDGLRGNPDGRRGNKGRNWQLLRSDLPDWSVIRRYAHHMEQRGLRPTTISDFTSRLVKFGRFFYPDSILTVDRDRLQLYLDSYNHSPRVRYSWISMLEVFFDWCIEEELITGRNPAGRIRRPKLRRTVPRPIATEDLEVAVECAPPLIKAFLLLASLQGLRTVEIAGLDRHDVLDAHTPPMLVVTKAKGGNQRVLPLHPDVLAALRVYGIDGRRENGPLFRTATGRGYTPQYVSATLSGYLRDLGVPATAHQLRHWFATSIYASTHDLRLTQELLGHQSPDTTAMYAAWAAVDAAPAVLGLTTRAPRLYDTKGAS